MSNSALLDVAQLNAEYAAIVDSGDWDRWTEFFLEDGHYSVIPRENFERGLPLCTLKLISRGMMLDRAYGVRETLYHDPYYQRHVVGLPRILSDDGRLIRSEANYSVFRTKLSEFSTVFNVGRYLDEIVRTPEGLRFKSRTCIYDSEMIPNAIIYPI
ncbi:MAG: aromatic-ring-hydroxylating dioxygenase subunit beta [Panacagrimonas sp.]